MVVVSLLFLIVAVVGIGLFVWWLACLIQALQYGDSAWAAADQNKWLYVALMVFLGIIGTLAFVLVARPELRRVSGVPGGVAR